MKLFFPVLALICCAGSVFAQSIPSFKPLRYDEDYTFLKNDTSHNWYRKLKYTALSTGKAVYLSAGGEVRYQYFSFKNEDWGEAPEDKDGYILTRYLGHVDLHAGKQFRAFVQLQSSLANGKSSPPSRVDENQLDLHQAFVDFRLPLGQQEQLTVRAGRQELLYGSQRLVAVRDGPNNRQSFDGAKLMYVAKHWKTDLFYTNYVQAQPHIFDDAFNKDTRFWGSYTVVNAVPVLQNIDLYYLGLRKHHSGFDDGSGEERRHSIGGRIWKSNKALRYDLEGVYQFGSLGEKGIHAWTLSANAGYKFMDIKGKPELGLKTEWISGDKNYNDQQLQTFNPLFPRGAYFGLAALIGPANLFDVHPSLALELTPQLALNFDYDLFRRFSRNDGLYGPSGALLYSGKDVPPKAIGSQLATDLVYTPNAFLYFRAECTWFKAGDYLKAVTPGKNILFTGVTMQLKF
jgi:hypothetical protein